MGFQLEFEVENEKQLSAELGIMADNISDFSEPMKKTADAMMAAVDDNYNQRGKRFRGWAPRVPQYRAGVRSDTHPLLEKSGRMRSGMYKESGKDFAMVGNRDSRDIFKYHQSNEPRKKIPRRIMLMMDAKLNTEIFKIFQEYIVRVLRQGR